MKTKRILSTVAIALGASLVAIAAYVLMREDVRYVKYIPEQTPVYRAAQAGDGQADFRVAAEMSVHAVVHIKTSSQRKNSTYDDFFGLNPFRDFYGIPRQQKTEPVLAAGSGVIISQDGYIVTNNHVVGEADLVEVTLNDKRTYKATIVGLDPTTDLALIKIEEEGLPILVYGNSDDVVIGEWVLAVGNPFNLTSTVTAGIVSAKARNINILGGNSAIESFIQTDAAVNPGNSGGALVNTQGELIGINAAIASNTGSYAGYSFAIPVNIARKVVEDLVNYGEVQRAFLGVTINDINSQFALQNNIKELNGVYVNAVLENGSADDAGLEKGDIITEINGKSVHSSSELLGEIGQRRPGDKVTVFFIRDGKEKKAEAVLKNRNGDTGIINKEEKNVVTILGATFENVDTGDLAKLGARNGVKIVKIENGKLLSSGIKKGFIITHIDKKPIENVDHLRYALEGKRGGMLIEGVYPDGTRAYYGFGI